MKQYDPQDIVKSCTRIESGLRLAYDGVKACTFCTGAVEAPNYWDAEMVPENISKELIIEKRKNLFHRLNSDAADDDLLCRKCTHWVEKKFSDVSFDRLEFVNVAHFSSCNLRCNYCGFTKNNHFFKQKYDALKILKLFNSEDVTFEASVDFNAGEPTLMSDLDEYLNFFKEVGMRVRLYSNGVIYSPQVYDAVKDGTITWLIISVDAGTPSTFDRTKRSDKYVNVIRNLAKYREAEALGEGKVAAKYIFTEDTLSDDDIYGFVYAMLATGVVNVWLLYDYFLFHQDNISNQEKYIEAYAKMYVEFLKWNIEPSHFGDAAAGDVIPAAKDFMKKTKKRIEEIKSFESSGRRREKVIPIIGQVHRDLHVDLHEPIKYTVDDFDVMVRAEGLTSSRLVVAPAGVATQNLFKSGGLDGLNIVALGDVSKSKQGKEFCDVQVCSYRDLANLEFDAILITSEYFGKSILADIGKYADLAGKKLLLLTGDDLNKSR